MINCRVVQAGGITNVFDSSGNPSKLYNEAVEFFEGDSELALDVFLASQTEDYQDMSAVEPENSTVEDVLKFLTEQPQTLEETKSLNSKEIAEVTDVMKANGIKSLEELSTKLNELFKPEGLFEVDTKRLIKSGFYTKEEAENLNESEVFSTINKIEKTLNYGVEIDAVESNYTGIRNTSLAKNSLGVHPAVTESEVIQFVLENGEDALIESQYSFVSQNIAEGITGKVRAKNQPTQQKGQIEVENTESQEQVQEVISKLKQTGLAENVFQLSNEEINAKLEEIGVSDQLKKQILAYHGTYAAIQQLQRNFSNEEQYGELMDGTYFGDINLAVAFAGYDLFTEQSFGDGKIFKAMIDESTFETIDFEGGTPKGDVQLIEFIGQERYNEILERKRSGEIKGLILTNAQEYVDGVKDLTQYVIFDIDVVNVIDTFREEAIKDIAEINRQVGEQGMELVTNGFTYQNSVYLNTSNLNSETAIHEFQHLYVQQLKESKPELYNKGLELVQAELKIEGVDTNKVKVTPTDSSNPSFEKGSMQTFSLEGGRLEIGKINNSENYSILSLYVEDGNRRQGIAEKLLKKALNHTNYTLVGQASNDAAIALNYKLGMRAREDINLTLEETKAKRVEKNDEGSITMISIPPINKTSEIQSTIDYVKQTQPNLEGERLQEEILAQLTGERGIQLLESNKDSGIKEWLKEFWNSVMDMLGLTNMTPRQVSKLNIQGYADAIAVDLLRGENVIKKYSDQDINQYVEELIQSNEVALENEDGMPCAENGISFNGFKFGGKWKVSKDLKGMPSHRKGGVDVILGDKGVTISRGSSATLTAENGLVLGFGNGVSRNNAKTGSKWTIAKDLKGRRHSEGGIDIVIGEDGIKVNSGDGSDYYAEHGLLIEGEPPTQAEKDRLAERQKIADRLWKFGNTPNTRDSRLTVSITPDDPRWTQYYDPTSSDEITNSVLREYPPSSIYINPDIPNMSYSVYLDRLLLKEEEKKKEEEEEEKAPAPSSPPIPYKGGVGTDRYVLKDSPGRDSEGYNTNRELFDNNLNYVNRFNEDDIARRANYDPEDHTQRRYFYDNLESKYISREELSNSGYDIESGQQGRRHNIVPLEGIEEKIVRKGEGFETKEEYVKREGEPTLTLPKFKRDFLKQ